VLDRTAFFPGGGGQPADRGAVNGAEVLGLEERPDGAIVHVVKPAAGVRFQPDDVHAAEGFAPGSYVEGEVDVARRSTSRGSTRGSTSSRRRSATRSARRRCRCT